MSSLDYAAFPHIFDAVVSHLVSTHQASSLRAIALTSHSAYAKVYRACSSHLVIDYRDFTDEARTYLCRFRTSNSDNAHNTALAPPSVVDIHGLHQYELVRSYSAFHAILNRGLPPVIRLLNHHSLVTPPPCPAQIDTVIFHVRNWAVGRKGFPSNSWALEFPKYAQRIVLNVLHCPEFGTPDIDFSAAKADFESVQEIVLIVSPDCPPKGAEAFSRGGYFLINDMARSLLFVFKEYPNYCATLVGTEDWRAEWADLGSDTEEEEWSSGEQETGRELFIRAFMDVEVYDRSVGDFIRPAEEGTQALLGRIEFVARDAYRDRVGEEMFELMTVQSLQPHL